MEYRNLSHLETLKALGCFMYFHMERIYQLYKTAALYKIPHKAWTLHYDLEKVTLVWNNEKKWMMPRKLPNGAKVSDTDCLTRGATYAAFIFTHWQLHDTRQKFNEEEEKLGFLANIARLAQVSVVATFFSTLLPPSCSPPNFYYSLTTSRSNEAPCNKTLMTPLY